MQRSLNTLLTMVLLFLSCQVSAGQVVGTVEALQMPAWRETDGERVALAAGMRISEDDRIVTGKSARVLLKMSEGSDVKLGEDAVFDVRPNNAPVTSDNIFKTALNIIQGAFRFTTPPESKQQGRNVRVRVGSITIGIRGTDIWGRSQDGDDLFALIEGIVDVSSVDRETFTMDRPSTFFTVTQKKSSPVKSIPDGLLPKLANETELQMGQGVIRQDGPWGVNLMSLDTELAGEQVTKQLSDRGYAVNVQKVTIKGRDWYRVQVTGFVSKADALYFANAIDGSYGIHKPWLIRF